MIQMKIPQSWNKSLFKKKYTQFGTQSFTHENQQDDNRNVPLHKFTRPLSWSDVETQYDHFNLDVWHVVDPVATYSQSLSSLQGTLLYINTLCNKFTEYYTVILDCATV